MIRLLLLLLTASEYAQHLPEKKRAVRLCGLFKIEVGFVSCDMEKTGLAYRRTVGWKRITIKATSSAIRAP